MMIKRCGLIIIAAFLVSAGTFASASDAPYRVVNGPQEFYYGHISLTDIRNDGADPFVLRSGSDKGEPAALNLPIGPGDLIRTTGDRRVEIQFDNATIVRLDFNSELKIETILAQSLSTKNQITNLILNRGRAYVMFKQFDSRELFQVLTPLAAIKLKHNSVAVVGILPEGGSDIQVKYGKASLLYGSDPKALKDQVVYALERMTISPDGRFAVRDYRPDADFEAWNKSINDDFQELHKGLTPLPKPVQKLSKAVFEFAQKYGNHYGDWIYDDYFGYVWRPFYNDRYPWGTWAPYFSGRWSNYNGQMFWVPTEPWGWVPYHLGVWQWDKKKGWFWIPGSAFAPAWVDLTFFGGMFFAWRPWSMWDWGFYSYPYLFADWSMDPMFWYYGWRSGYGYGYYDDWGRDRPYVGGSGSPSNPPLRTVPKDKLRPPSDLPLAMPKEFRAGLKSLLEGLRKHDPAAVESLLALGTQARVIESRALGSADVREHALLLQDVLSAARDLPASDPAKLVFSAAPLSASRSQFYASRAFRAGEISRGPSAGPEKNQTVETALGKSRPIPAAVRSLYTPSPQRHLDWNPDVRLALRMGVNIRYASGVNQIYCPQLNISSSTTLASGSGGMGKYSGSATGGPAGGYGAGSGSSGAHAGGSVSVSSASSTAGSSGGGGHIKTP
jgi:hypothetical protein